MKKTLLSLSFLALLTACSSEPVLGPLHLDYSQMGKIYLDSQDLRIINRAGNTPQWAPYVGHQFKPSLTDAVYKLTTDRLQAAGTLGHATLIIKDANITEQSMSTSSDFESLFTRQQASKYIGRIEVSLEAQSPTDGAVAIANANAVHAVTLPEDPTEVEKTEAYRKLLGSLMTTLNSNLEQAIKTHMSRFILTGGRSEAPSPTQDSAMPVLMDGQ